MKQKTGPKFFRKLKRKDQFEIRSVEISPEKAVAGLAESVYEFGVAASRRQPTDVAPIPTDYLKTLVSIATNTWRAKNKMMDSATGEVREDMKRVDRHIEAICRSLAEVGIVIRDHTGDVYDEGQPMKVVASKPTPGLDRKRVSETLLPSIFWNNRLVQNGEIEISTPATTDKPVEP
jgi:hypothetical protein